MALVKTNHEFVWLTSLLTCTGLIPIACLPCTITSVGRNRLSKSCQRQPLQCRPTMGSLNG